MLRSRRRRRLLATVAPLAVATLIAACGGGAPSSAPSAPPTAVPSGVVAVQAKEFEFAPATITVPAGLVTFSVTNVGAEQHEFEIFEGETVVDGVEGIAPGLTKDLTVTLEAGAYTFKCLLNGHNQLGMTGTLTVN